MFIGHFALAPVAAATSKIKLWHAMVAVQFVDFIWAFFIMVGIEKVRIAPDFMAASHVDLHFMPYSHSLMFTLGWAVIAALAFKAFVKPCGWKEPIIIGALVLSHWFSDILVHAPDMTLYPGSEKIGFGLWNYLWLSFGLEIGIISAALIYYLLKTKPKSGKSFPIWCLYLGFLILLQASVTFGHPPGSPSLLALSALFGFSIIAFGAAIVERTRIKAD